jgi:hypothetical protein
MMSLFGSSKEYAFHRFRFGMRRFWIQWQMCQPASGVENVSL